MQDKYGVSDDPYCWPGSSTLRNALNIRDDALLADAEAEFAAVALERIDIEAPPFDLTYLCRLHRQLFGDLYDWAGEVRRVDIAKGTTRFCRADRIIPEADTVMEALAGIDIPREPWPRALSRLAECFGELNLIPPFRDGNGRSLRLFFEHLLISNGKAVDWAQIERPEWIDACIAAVTCNYAPIEQLLDRATSPLDSER